MENVRRVRLYHRRKKKKKKPREREREGRREGGEGGRTNRAETGDRAVVSSRESRFDVIYCPRRMRCLPHPPSSGFSRFHMNGL